MPDIKITQELLLLISEINEFKRTWRSLNTQLKQLTSDRLLVPKARGDRPGTG
jgi:hypothetical protein